MTITKEAIFEKLDDLLYLANELAKSAKTSSERDAQTTDQLNRIVADIYTGHPDNTVTPKAGRWGTYSSLASDFDRHLEKYQVSKGLHARNLESLNELINNLTSIKKYVGQMDSQS